MRRSRGLGDVYKRQELITGIIFSLVFEIVDIGSDIEPPCIKLPAREIPCPIIFRE
jgi:hypothetical protein